MSDVNDTFTTNESNLNEERQVTTTSTRKANLTTSDKETNMTTSTTPNVIRVADLSAADKKTLQRLFGCLPDSRSVTLTGRKGTAKTQVACECGCGKDAASLFLSGHDASLKTALRAVSEGREPSCPEGRGSNARSFSRKAALAEIARRGW